MDHQSETVDFLSSGRAFGTNAPVEVVETHGAYIFLSGDTALKLKRAVTYDYMDLGTVEKRRAMLERELELNRPTAPGIYRDIVAVTRSGKGLTLDGDGRAEDWVLRMWRFPAENELDAVAERGEFDDSLADATGTAIAAYHGAAEVRHLAGRALISDILEELGRVFGEFPEAAGTKRVTEWRNVAAAAFSDVAELLDAREAAGHVRRGHGDLHLRNMVLIEDRPVPFDALEFDETLGTCDVLYDIAFLIMDLCHRGLDRAACRVLDAWLREARGGQDSGLAALPLFLSVRAAIRAMVLLQTDAARDREGASADDVAAYLDLACAALRPAAPILIAVGGYSGSGKSVLARSLAAGCGALPGAVTLASDLERKAGLDSEKHLAPESYSAERRGAVYRAMLARAKTLLAAGHSVILDATFLDPARRVAADEAAARAGVPFCGFWLTAPREVLEHRLRGRKGDASDAGVAVLASQLAADAGAVDWVWLDVSGTPEMVRAEALGALAGVKPEAG